MTEQDWQDAADIMGIEVPVLKAVAEVESAGSGFNPEGFPKTLFEGHWFSKLTKGKFDKTNPTLSYPTWTKAFYGKSWQAEKQRLDSAVALDRNAALMSASWGKFQIMGFNFPKAGFKTIQSFVNAMCKDEKSQLIVFVQYIMNSGLDDELRNKNWASFARQYNGPRYKENSYDTKLQQAYLRFSK